MQIHLIYTTQLKAALGTDRGTVSLPDGSTVQDLIKHLSEQHTATFRRLVVDDQNNLFPSMLICVDDNQVSAPFSKPLSDGATVTFLSAVSGG